MPVAKPVYLSGKQFKTMVKKIVRYLILLVTVFISLSTSSMAQESTIALKQESTVPKTHDFWHRISVGGNVGFQFGAVSGIVLSPEVMIRIVDQLHGGLGFTYEYNSFKNYYFDTTTNQYLNFTLNIYGGRIFLRYYLSSIFDNFLGNLFVHAEYEYLTYTRTIVYDPKGSIFDIYNNTYSRGKQVVEVNSLFIGGGYHQPVGGRVFLDLLILYNLNDSYSSPYSNPLFRVGFGVGL